MSIVKQLVELHGGNARVKSPGPGKGATFIIALPLSVIPQETDSRRVHPKTPSKIDGECGDVDLSGIRILYVDDEADARMLVKRILERCQAEVMTAGSVAQALELFQERRPDVIVSDIGMPERDGHDLIRSIRALPTASGGNVPAAALSAFARSEDRRRALLAGFQTHVAKPIEPAELVAVVATLVGRTGSM